MITQELINRGGSKLEITRLLLEQGADVPVPRSSWKYYGGSLDPLLAEFEKMTKPVIVRGSHKNDYHGFIDVVPTRRNVQTISELEDAVKHIEQFIKSDDVRTHCLDWGQDYSEEVHVLVQEQSPSGIMGSMLRNPHTGQITIQYGALYKTDKTVADWPISNALIEKKLWHVSFSNIQDAEIEELVDMYKRFENSGVPDISYSQHVEFGLQPLLFFQGRPFKKIEPAQSFELPTAKQYLRSSEPIGITGSKGIDVHFFPIDHHYIVPKNVASPYGLLWSDTRNRPPVGLSFGNLKAVIGTYSTSRSHLFHSTYQFMKRADYSLINNKSFTRAADRSRFAVVRKIQSIISKTPPDKEITTELGFPIIDKQLFADARLYSNGNAAVLIPTKYL